MGRRVRKECYTGRMTQTGVQGRSVPHADTRVILVGKTGLDAALRLDHGIDLVRVRSPVDAIGELANPPECDHPIGRAVVVVAPEVEESLRPPGEAGQLRADAAAIREMDRLTNFIRGLRLAEPSVRVLAVSGNEPVQGASEFDGAVSTGWDPPALARYIRAGNEGAQRPTQPQTPAPTGPGDSALVSLLLHGRDLLPAAIELIRERTGDPGVTFSIETSVSGHEVAWEGVVFGRLSGRGADIPHHARWLAGWLRLRDQQTQLKAAAFTDPLTGAWNRRFFDRHLAAAMEQARIRRQTVTVLLFDIDDFKKYNDQYGHEAGDEILVESVRLMRTAIRPSDRVCRIGGDEFAVIFHDPEGPRREGSMNTVSVMEVAGRFRRLIHEHRFPKLAGCAPGTLTISGGMATFPWDGGTPQELLSKADQLALQAKQQGKNAITFGPGSQRECGKV